MGIGVAWDESGNAHVRVNVDPEHFEALSKQLPKMRDGVSIELRGVRDLRALS